MEKNNENKNDEFIAGHVDSFIVQDDKLLKKGKKPEFNFYENTLNENHEFHKLTEFIPKFYGQKIIEDKNYLVMENLLNNHPKASIIDIKLGKNVKKKNFIEKC